MDWRDEGVLLSARLHGETSAIVEVFTKEHGRHAGLVRGGISRKMTPILQPGNQVQLAWSARLEEHLGTYVVDLIRSRSSVLQDRLATSAMASLAALLRFSLPERQHLPRFYELTQAFLEALVEMEDWQPFYALWEVALLEELGFGLDLTRCAATGEEDDLIYVSPKSGQAVSADAGAPYADRMLPLPAFLRGAPERSEGDVLAALNTTGFFLSRRLAPHLGNRPIPKSRDRFIAQLARRHL